MARKLSKSSTRGRARKPRGKGGKSALGGPLSLPLLERLVRLMDDNGLTDLQVEDGEQRVILSRSGMGGAISGPASIGGNALPMPAQGASSQSPASMPSSPSATVPSHGRSEAGAVLVEIKSPMVGTYYASSSPDAKPFVKIGDRVGPDTDVCIIEAMKVFNNIKAETSGTIEKILAENGQPVEYGQVLFLVRPQ